jgi:hypothetical protein
MFRFSRLMRRAGFGGKVQAKPESKPGVSQMDFPTWYTRRRAGFGGKVQAKPGAYQTDFPTWYARLAGN